MSRSASLRRPGRLENASARGPTTRSMPWRNLKYGFRRFSSLDPGSQPPAGDSATTLSARPRCASSSASQPPSEVPTRCAFSIPAASMSASTPSARAFSEGVTPAGNEAPPQWPSSVTLVTSWCSERAGRSGSQMPAVPEKPWMRTSGSGMLCTLVFNAMAEKVNKTEQEWREQLNPEQYEVLRRAATEAPFTGRYVNEKSDGTYRCAACGNELFRSDTKFESGTGWPSFTDPVNRENVELETDHSHGMVRTEVKCARCGSHLGHVFDDGPGPSGERFCMNSCALDLDPS